MIHTFLLFSLLGGFFILVAFPFSCVRFLIFEKKMKIMNLCFFDSRAFYGPLLVTIVLVAENRVERSLLALRTAKKGINRDQIQISFSIRL